MICGIDRTDHTDHLSEVWKLCETCNFFFFVPFFTRNYLVPWTYQFRHGTGGFAVTFCGAAREIPGRRSGIRTESPALSSMIGYLSFMALVLLLWCTWYLSLAPARCFRTIYYSSFSRPLLSHIKEECKHNRRIAQLAKKAQYEPCFGRRHADVLAISFMSLLPSRSIINTSEY